MGVLMLTILLVQETDLSVITMDGESVNGQLLALDAQKVQLQTSEGVRTIPTENLAALRRQDKTSARNDSRRIVMRDGSQLVFDSLEAGGGEFAFRSNWLGDVSIPFGNVQAIRFQEGEARYASQWENLKERDTSSELLVVKKRDDSGLDFLPGSLSSIHQDSIGFVISGNELPVPVSRVFGIVMRNSESRFSTGKCQVKSGDEMFPAESVVLEGDVMIVTSTLLGTRSVELSSLTEIDFASGRVQFLSAMPTISSEYLVSADSAAGADEQLAELFRQQFRPRMNETMDKGEPLRLGGRQYRNGIWMCASSRAVWALDGEYSSLEAMVGIDEMVAHKGDRQAQLIVETDGNPVVDMLLRTSAPPKRLTVPLDGVQTLTVIVRDGGDGTQLDWVDLANARLIRATAPAAEGN